MIDTTGTVASEFSQRHIGPSTADTAAMLRTVGATSIEALIAETIPPSIRQTVPLEVGPALTETEALSRLRGIALQNEVYVSLIGQGYHGTIVPSVIQRNILESPAWYTAYTPYQPEISQGRLEALINYQTMVCDLTGLDVANASLLDESTAAAEAMALAKRVSTSKSSRFFVDGQIHPQTLAVLETRAEPLGWTLTVGDPDLDLETEDVFGAIFQYPGTYGDVRDLRRAMESVHRKGGIAILAADPMALTLLTSPGVLGADVAIGSTQRLGVPLGYGGPHAAYMATRNAFTRAMPGRLVGVSVDARQTTAYRLTLQTREQHIRREKATSNICTAQVLLAVMASMYGVYHGPEGLTRIATDIHGKTVVLRAGLERLGFDSLNSSFFDTLTVDAGQQREEIIARAASEKINFRVLAAGERGCEQGLGISLDETTTPETIEAVWRAFGGNLQYGNVTPSNRSALPESLRRDAPFLQHPVFHRHRSEAGLTRYMRKLADRDLALDRTMIPLGSCTMKLNATTEMIPVTWPEFSSIHPFAPETQARGYRRLLDELERQLCAITGYDAMSMQPNSGAQGEFAGLLAIRGYHRSRGDAKRDVCLIPTSAHGTNPASAHMAGMEVVAVRCDAGGNVEIPDLEAKAQKYADRLAAAMVTYPSTHGVFEAGIGNLCEIVHRYGGQVYLDGANLNAQVGLCRPGDYGADVSHLNLHKTFCIPHGGGGPGMGPIGVKAHLKPFLPGHPALTSKPSPVGPVSAAPYGSTSILPIAYAYILMMSGDGLRRATETAILAANYVAVRLDPHFPVLYRNARGRVAHECIIDPRPLQETCGVTAEDIAKRLMDFGFHAPTMSFPVAGTLMIEPTESEPLAELDRFCAAMIAIRNEIRDVENKRFPIADSPLRRAPHTARDLADDNWNRPYSRAEGCFPAETGHSDKYWPPVNRIDNVYGDRNLFCSCPPVEAAE